MLRIETQELFMKERPRRIDDPIAQGSIHPRISQHLLLFVRRATRHQHHSDDIGAEVQLGRNVLSEIAFHRMPVDPNPPAPRVDGGSALVSSRSGVATDRINSCAIRAAASTIKS